MLLAAENLPDHGCKPWEVEKPGVALQAPSHLGLLGGHTDVQSWSLGLNQLLDPALGAQRRKGKALTPLQA